MLFQMLVGNDEKLREISVSSSSQADNYGVVMAVDLVKLRAAIVLIVRVSIGTSYRDINSKCFRCNVTKIQDARDVSMWINGVLMMNDFL